MLSRAVQLVSISLAFIGCWSVPSDRPRAGNAGDVAMAAAMSAREISKDCDTIVYAWKLEPRGDRVQFFTCSTETACSEERAEIDAKALLGVETVGRTQPTLKDGSVGPETDLLRLRVGRDNSTSRGGVATDPQRGMTFGTTPGHCSK